MDPECQAKGSREVFSRVQQELANLGLSDEVQVLETPRIGNCARGPEMAVYPDEVNYAGMEVDDIPYLVKEHFLKGRIVPKFQTFMGERSSRGTGHAQAERSARGAAQLRQDRSRKHRRLYCRRRLSGLGQSAGRA